MADFNASLLREKFVIRDSSGIDDGENVIALSNRIPVPLINRQGEHVETFIVRAQNMHTTVRCAAKIIQSFDSFGPIGIRLEEFDWLEVWESVTEGYEKKYNPNCWVAIYYEGKCIWQKGEEHHPFLDVIERFDFLQKEEYVQSIKLAEKAFKDAGKQVTIEHDTNVALVVSINPEQARCGVILRGAKGTTTFNFTAKKRLDKEVRTSQCLSVSAAFLEGIQLAFAVGLGKKKIHYELLEDEDERKKIFDGEKRLGRLNMAISQFDQAQSVMYRPDRPDFFKHMAEAEKTADKILKPQIQAKLEAGELDQSDWVE